MTRDTPAPGGGVPSEGGEHPGGLEQPAPVGRQRGQHPGAPVHPEGGEVRPAQPQPPRRRDGHPGAVAAADEHRPRPAQGQHIGQPAAGVGVDDVGVRDPGGLPATGDQHGAGRHGAPAGEQREAGQRLGVEDQCGPPGPAAGGPPVGPRVRGPPPQGRRAPRHRVQPHRVPALGDGAGEHGEEVGGCGEDQRVRPERAAGEHQPVEHQVRHAGQQRPVPERGRVPAGAVGDHDRRAPRGAGRPWDRADADGRRDAVAGGQPRRPGELRGVGRRQRTVGRQVVGECRAGNGEQARGGEEDRHRPARRGRRRPRGRGRAGGPDIGASSGGHRGTCGLDLSSAGVPPGNRL